MKVVGIDPGCQFGTKNVGFAVWNCSSKKTEVLETLYIHQVFFCLRDMVEEGEEFGVVFEDARNRGGPRSKIRGAGYVMCACNAIENFLVDQGIPYGTITPKAGGATKVSPKIFEKDSGISKRTSNHARDAFYLARRSWNNFLLIRKG